MYRTKSSSSDINMAICNTFEYLLNQIKSSNLNYHLQQSPFAAVISLKKSLIKDKNGNPLTPSLPVPGVPVPAARHADQPDAKCLKDQIIKLEKIIRSLECAYEEAVLDSEEAHRNVAKIKDQLEILKAKVGDEKIDNLKVELKSISVKYDKSRCDLSELKIENENLKKNVAYQSTQLKAANRDLKHLEKLKIENEKSLETKISQLKEFKLKCDIEKRELKKKQKKENKKKKRDSENVAKEKLASKNVDIKDTEQNTTPITDSDLPCTHTPQCSTCPLTSPPLPIV